MIYAVLDENNIVVNIIVGLPEGINGICTKGFSVAIGDEYVNGVFVKKTAPTVEEQIADLKLRLAELEALNGNG